MKKLMFLLTLSVLLYGRLCATECQECIINYCTTTYPTDNDGDGDGMNDTYEMQLARMFKPILFLDDASADWPTYMPPLYSTPPYSHDGLPHFGMPEDVVSDGTIYVHVRPFQIFEPGRAYYIEIQYWFYYMYSQTDCHAGYIGEHGHDWEHIAICLAKPPGSSTLQVVQVYYSQHDGGEYKEVGDLFWTGTPGLSNVGVFVANGSHASYPSIGDRCVHRTLGFCDCSENPEGGYMLPIDDSKVRNLYELGNSNAPLWLNYYPYRWPGDYSDAGNGTPYGPAYGNHAVYWNYGHFYSGTPLCIKTNLESVPEPDNFVISNYKDEQPIDNALYITWDDPTSGPEDGFALMRKPFYGYGNGWDTTGYTCLAQLQPGVHEYTDTCLDGGTGWWYKLETYRNNPDPLYRGCSIPLVSVKDGWVNGNPCPGSLVPARPTLLSCNNCVLTWADNSTNEDGFHIKYNGSIVGTVGANVTSFSVSDCNTGKFGYHVSAYNQYGETSAPGYMPCNGGESGCPFVYTWDGSDYVKDNNLLAASEDSTLSRVNMTGFCLLKQPLVPQSNQYKLQIREFEKEHSLFDYISLITLDHPANKKIALTPSGKPYSYTNPRPPISCVDNRGFDCLAQIADEDSLYYKNDQPGFMIVNFGVLSKVTGQYKPLTDGGGGGVPEPPKEPDPLGPPTYKLTPFASSISGNLLSVEVFQDSVWIPVGKLYPQSKPSLRLIEFNSFIKPQQELKLRLSWKRAYSANQIAFYNLESSSLVLHNLNLSSAVNLSSGDIGAKLSGMDNNFAELKPAETAELAFPYLPLDSNMQRDFIVAAKGYYYSEDIIGQYSSQLLSDTTNSLQQNYPNPFNPETQIRFVLPKPARVKLEVYNLLGQKVVTLLDREMTAGPNTIVWDGKNGKGENVSSGIYFYRLEAGDLKETKKMIIVR